MKTILKLGLALVPVLLCLIHSCKNSDNVKPLPTADFYIYESPTFLDFPQLWITYDTDTICGNDIEFRVAHPMEGVKYHWQIGQGTYEGESVVLRVGDLENISMDATLTASAPFPGAVDSTYQVTATRAFYILPVCFRLSYPKSGTYRGYLESKPNEVYEIELVMDSVFQDDVKEVIYRSVNNLTNDGCLRYCTGRNCAPDGAFRHLTMIAYETDDSSCERATVRFYCKDPESIEVYISEWHPDNHTRQELTDRFIGTKINN